MAHPLVVAHPPVAQAQAQNGPRGSGIRPAGGLDDRHLGPTPTTATSEAAVGAIFRGLGQRTIECAPTPEGVPGRPIPNPPRYWQPGLIDCEEE